MIELEPRKRAASSRDGSGDPDGIRTVARDSGGRRDQKLFLGVAMFLVAVSVGYILMPRPAPPPQTNDLARQMPSAHVPPIEGPDASAVGGQRGPEDAIGAVPVGATPVAAQAASSRRYTSRRVTNPKENKITSPDDSEDPSQQPEFVGIPRDVTAKEYIQALHDAGIYEGIGAFNPPGTSPPLEGLKVPDDYVLPDGYVRHYQSTDDGQDIPPILMYHPDYEFFDANGNPVQIPEDRVVPPDQAPDGFPIDPVKIPKPKEREPGDTGRW